MLQKFDSVECDPNPDLTSEKKRLKLAEFIKPDSIETTPPNHGSIFIIGPNNAAIHSEPPIHSERLFISVVQGTSEQIEDLRTRWQAKKTTYSL